VKALITIKNVSRADDVIHMQARDGTQLIGEAAAELRGNAAEITKLAEYQPGLAYEIGKALLNAVDLRGIPTVLCRDDGLRGVLTRLRFSEENGEYFLPLQGYFSSNCDNL
jgi:hypothetical protein